MLVVDRCKMGLLMLWAYTSHSLEMPPYLVIPLLLETDPGSLAPGDHITHEGENITPTKWLRAEQYQEKTDPSQFLGICDLRIGNLLHTL